MRRIERTGWFKRDYKRESKGVHRARLEKLLVDIVTRLTSDEALSARHRDQSSGVIIGSVSARNLREALARGLDTLRRQNVSGAHALLRAGGHWRHCSACPSAILAP